MPTAERYPVARRTRPRRRAAGAAGLLVAVVAVAGGCGGGSGGGTGGLKGQRALDARPPFTSSGARAAAAAAVSRSFRSRQDLHPARVTVTRHSPAVAPGYVFISPRPAATTRGGPMILDDRGRIVWFKQLPEGLQAVDFKVQRYRRAPVLTWGQRPTDGHGDAVNVITDRRYRLIATVRAAGDGVTTDLHDFELLPGGRALVLAYRLVPRDLSAYGGPSDGEVQEPIVQIIDVRTQRVEFEWHGLDHIGLGESYVGAEGDDAFDYVHANSLALTRDGNILMSARSTSTVYEINRRTGRIMWRLGGKRSTFRMARGARFAAQHDAEPHRDGTITVFDNASTDKGSSARSSGKRIRVDVRRHRARLVRDYRRPRAVLSTSQGNYQVLPNGGAFVGWGSQPVVSEFSRDGRLVFDARLPTRDQQSYRAFRFPWTGRPTYAPVLAATRDPDGRVSVYASWNGSTLVRHWAVLAGPSPRRLALVGSARWGGFETKIRVRSRARYVAVAALDASHRVLRRSRAVVLPP